jgi:hypothetical protein
MRKDGRLINRSVDDMRTLLECADKMLEPVSLRRDLTLLFQAGLFDKQTFTSCVRWLV